MAQNTYDLDDLDEGQVLLNLSVSEETQIQQDLLSAVLQFMVRGPDSTALQNEVNQRMTQALDTLGKAEGLDYQTQQYHVHPVYSRRDDPEALEKPIWQAQQGLRLSSLDSPAVLAAVAELQAQGLQVQHLGYSLSPAAHRQASEALLEAAIASLQRKAQQTAQLLGKQRADIIELSLNDSPGHGLRTMSMARASADSAEMAPPVAEPGRTTVTVSVSARALISP
ncbi:MAG: SIMPL domain-containing protein [Wenzhouxiangella sp.]|nr:SIMPL domain-containing protein [Wenzhouxiangella sp.]